MRAGIATLIFLSCLGWSLLSSMGLYALARNEAASSTGAVQASYADLKSQRDHAQQRLDAIGSLRPSSQIDADIAAARRDKLWDRSKQCTEATTGESRSFCARIDKLTGELGAAKEAEGLKSDVGSLQTKMSGVDLGTVLRVADPQAAALSRLTGLSEDRVRDIIAMFLAVLLELLSGFTLFALTPARRAVAAATEPKAVTISQQAKGGTPVKTIESLPPAANVVAMPAPKPAKVVVALAQPAALPSPAPLKAVGAVDRYAAARLKPAKGRKLSADELFADYSRWCAVEKCEPLEKDVFGERFATLSKIIGIEAQRGMFADVALVA